MLFKVSFIISKLDFTIITEIKNPKYPSRLIPQIKLITAATSVEKDKTASIKASVPEAIKLCESIFSPTLFTCLPKKNFTITATIIIISEAIV